MSGFDNVADALADDGRFVWDAFLSADELARVREVVSARRARFARAGVGRAAGQQVNDRIRGDDIEWLEDGDAELGWLQARLDEVRQALNATLYLGLARLECHFAAYPAGQCYQRHLDQHRGQDTRVVTMVLYLNQDWHDGDGGYLRVYLDDGSSEDVRPDGGKLVLFMSNRFEHEVLPATRERWSLTGWYRRAELL
ncbi:2OG-Fe(II) oxygenase [Chitinibacteraceae bacterium HSL-7]